MMSSRSPLAYTHEDLGSLTSLQMKAHEDYVTEHGLEDNLSYKEAVIGAFCALGSLKKTKGSGEGVRSEVQLATIWVEYKHRLIQDFEILAQRDQKKALRAVSALQKAEVALAKAQHKIVMDLESVKTAYSKGDFRDWIDIWLDDHLPGVDAATKADRKARLERCIHAVEEARVEAEVTRAKACRTAYTLSRAQFTRLVAEAKLAELQRTAEAQSFSLV